MGRTSTCDSALDTTGLFVPQTKEDFPGTTKKLVDDIKTAGWEGGKVCQRCVQHLPLDCALSTMR